MKHKIKIEDIRKEKVFQVPEGYFHTLPVLIQHKISEVSTRQGRLMPKENIFLIPESYFEQLPQDIQAKITILNSNVLSEKKPQQIFHTPDNYFEDLSLQIQAKISKQNTQSQANFTLQRQLVYAFAGIFALIFMIYGGINLWQFDQNQNKSFTKQNNQEIIEENKAKQAESLTQNQKPETQQTPEIENKKEITQSNQLIQKPIVDQESYNSNHLAYQALKEVPTEVIDAYLQNSPHSDEEIIETLLDTEQAAGMNDLAELLLESDHEELYQAISDQDMDELDRLFDTTKNEKLEK